VQVLVLTILSGLALWALLILLIVMLNRIRRALEGIHTTLGKIAMGVRAIESETALLPAELPTTASGLAQIADGAELIAARLSAAETKLASLA
jgi:uncharacterized protein YoxC